MNLLIIEERDITLVKEIQNITISLKLLISV